MSEAKQSDSTDPLGPDAEDGECSVPPRVTDALTGMVTLAQAEAMVAAERERCAAKCLRPAGWLREDQQRLVDEIRVAILSGA